jgi:hypothetical protein
MRVQSGERVIVQTPQQQQAQRVNQMTMNVYTQSAPTVVAPGVAHTVEIELGSLFTPESVPPDRVRVWFNGVVVIDAKHPLHPVKPGQMTVGRSPLGMPTAGRFLEV